MPRGHVSTMNCYSPASIPIGSVLALLLSWFGIGFYCSKMHSGLGAVADVAERMFKDLLPYIESAQLALVILASFMLATTLAMALVGAFATVHCHGSFETCFDPANPSPHTSLAEPSARWHHRLRPRLGGSVACTLFIVLNYILNLCWLGIFAFTVALTAVYFAFKPLCLPQAGHPITDLNSPLCFNFTMFSMLLARNNPEHAVNLVMCGNPISQFCRLTAVLLPWYWGAFVGCILVLLGLNHFNACLAANFAHNRRACQYRRFVDHQSFAAVSPKSNNSSYSNTSRSLESELVFRLQTPLEEIKKTKESTRVYANAPVFAPALPPKPHHLSGRLSVNSHHQPSLPMRVATVESKRRSAASADL